MTDNDKFALATQIFVRLRRVSGRTVDVIWMVGNGEYAAEILRLARDSGDDELARLADRFAGLAGSSAAVPAAAPVRPTRAPSPSAESDADKHYIGTLR